MNEQVEKIDMTPTWESLHPLFLRWIRSGKREQRKIAEEHFMQLCKLADIINEHKKHGGLNCSCGTILELWK